MGYLSRIIAAARSSLSAHFIRYRAIWAIVCAFVLVVAFAYWLLASPPAGYPRDSLVTIPQGASAEEVAQVLARDHVVRSALAFRYLLRFTGASAHIHPGPYRLTYPEDMFRVASRLGAGIFGIPPTRITFAEGETVRDMAAKVAAAYPGISVSDFITVAGPDEGYLFPDTYLFPPDATAQTIVKTMHDNFNAKIASLLSAIHASGHTLSQIVIMASLIEKEARTPDSRRMVSGILWNRINDGMPLQVDAVFGFIFNRSTYAPSLVDLGVDSPYNTYLHRGLPPGPIDNPGLDSLTAAAEPAKTDDLYYLTGTDGLMHYARTYPEQLANQRLYLHS